jgi:transcriptional regulator with XRE-family HTH domain
MTAQQLADEIAALGGKLTRQAVSKIENGDRGVSLEEVLLLGRALRVPPLLLFLPVGRVAEMEAIPGDVVDTYAVAKWATGAGPYPGPRELDENGLATWRDGAAPIVLYRDHERWADVWASSRHEPRSERAVLAQAQIHLTRRTMRQLGLVLPPLPEGATDDISALGLEFMENQQRWLRDEVRGDVDE